MPIYMAAGSRPVLVFYRSWLGLFIIVSVWITMYKALFLVLAGKSELEMYSGEENGGQSARDGAELGSSAFCICFTRMFI